MRRRVGSCNARNILVSENGLPALATIEIVASEYMRIDTYELKRFNEYNVYA